VQFFFRQVVRYAQRHKLLALINILSIALGVAVFLAVQIANRSAVAAFEAGVDLVAGRAEIEARGVFPDQTWPRLSKLPGITAATPLVEGTVTLPDLPDEYLHIIGLDPFTNGPFQTFKLKDWRLETRGNNWFGNPESIVIAKGFANRHQLKAGDRLRVRVNEKVVDLQVTSILEAADVDTHLAAMDIGWAQELFGKNGQLSAVLFRVSDPKNPESVIQEIRRIVPPDVSVEPPSQRSVQVAKMLAGFQLNLTALSMVSLLVGMFLVYNTITASVARRRLEIGIMRCVGTSRRRVQWLFLGEALLYGICGAFLGCVAGVVLSNYLIGVVARTVSNLYILTSVEHFTVPLWELPFVFLLGTGTAVLGAWLPARSAADLPPLQALNPGLAATRPRWSDLRWVLLSLVSAGLGCLTGWIALTVFRPAGFAAAFFILTAACLLAPSVTGWVGLLVARIGLLPRLIRLAGNNFARSINRHAVAVAAVGAAVAMLVSVSVMIYSFRVTVTRWVDRRLVADIFLSPAANEIVGFENYLSPALITFVRGVPGIEYLDFFRDQTVRCNGESVSLAVVGGSTRNTPEFVGGDSQRKYQQFFTNDVVIASEPLARRLHLRGGEKVVLATPNGDRAFQVAGVFYDYTRDAGLLMMQAANFQRYWHDDRFNSLAIYLRPGASTEQTIEHIRSHYPGADAYAIRSNRDLRTLVTKIFDQTFAITYVLRFVASIVAVSGITLNLVVLIKERERETGVLRSIGVSRIGMSFLVMGESGLVALSALVLGLIGGVGLSYVLTEVINKAFFGWTIPVAWPARELVTIPLLVLSAAFLAGLFPAWQVAKIPIIEMVRE
jgi:putative ABC transport system permease protein